MNAFILALALCGQRDLSAEGYTLESVSAEGVRTWSKPLTMSCGSGSCGSRSLMGGCSSGSCGTQMGGCSSGSCGSRRGSMGGPGPVPKLVPANDEPATPSEPTKPIAKSEPVDTDKIAAAIVEKMASDPRFKGPKGDKGEAGPAGPPGKDAGPVDEEHIAALVLAKIDYAKIAGMVKVNAPVPPAVNSEKHIVVVADKNAGYWARLGGEVATAQQSYRGIEIADKPPFDVGPMPQIIQYENGIPRVLGKGQHDVSEVLSRLARGEF